MKRILTILLLLPVVSFSQMTVDNTTLTVEQYVQTVLVGTGVTVSNVQFNGGSAAVTNAQVGEFDDPGANIGLNGGLIMGSGDVQLAAQLNTGGGSSLGGTGQMGTDPDLQSITPNQIYDEAIIEFDFVPMGDTIRFNYAFASEEYEEYVCGSVNDAFGFFLSGPNPAGGNYTAQNIALIPDPTNPSVYTTTPVSINTVNPGVAGSAGTASNCAAIDPNWTAYNIFYTPNTSNAYEYDGGTVVLEALAAVECGETYHIKLAIGDGGDGAFDSGVFLEEGSFGSEAVHVSVTTVSGDDFVIEGCTDATFNFVRPDTTGDLTIQIDIGGNAINGTDYATINDSVYFQPGQDSVVMNVSPILDGISEATDTLTITVYTVTVCGDTVAQDATILIYNVDSLQVMTTPDTIVCNNEFFLLEASASEGVGPYDYSWSTGSVSPTALANVQGTETYTLTVSDACGNQIEDSVTLITPDPLSITLVGGEYCVDDTIVLTPILSGGIPTYDITWNGTGNIAIDQSSGTATVTNASSGIFELSMTDYCGLSTTEYATVTVEVCDITVPNVMTPNGDGQNDYLVIEGMDYHPNSQIFVYNRWGKLVYKSENYQNDWDGTHYKSGKTLADGVYYYVLELVDMEYCERPGVECQGNVTLFGNK